MMSQQPQKQIPLKTRVQVTLRRLNLSRVILLLQIISLLQHNQFLIPLRIQILKQIIKGVLKRGKIRIYQKNHLRQPLPTAIQIRIVIQELIQNKLSRLIPLKVLKLQHNLRLNLGNHLSPKPKPSLKLSHKVKQLVEAKVKHNLNHNLNSNPKFNNNLNLNPLKLHHNPKTNKILIPKQHLSLLQQVIHYLDFQTI